MRVDNFKFYTSFIFLKSDVPYFFFVPVLIKFLSVCKNVAFQIGMYKAVAVSDRDA